MSSGTKVAPAEVEQTNTGSVLDMITRTPAQIKLLTQKQKKQMVVATVLLAVFIDILGTAVVIPSLANLCAYAEGGPAITLGEEIEKEVQKGVDASGGTMTKDQVAQAAGFDDLDDMIEHQQLKFISPYAFKDPPPPVKYSLSMNLIMSAGMFGSAGGSIFFGRMSDRIGSKIPLQICVFMGIIGYALIYLGGRVVGNYWLFALGMFWNNFFGNTMGVAQVYFGKIFKDDEKERDKYVGMVLAMGLVGGAIGGLVVMPFVTRPKNGENFFNSIWLCIGLTVFSFLNLTFVLPKDPKQEKTVKEQVETPDFVKKILYLTILASALDSAGDEGTRMARGTIMTAVFPEWATIERQNYLLMGLLGLAICSVILLEIFKKCLNLAAIAVLGCACTLAVQLLLLIEWDDVPFITIWHAGKLFGIMSTIASGYMIQSVAPPEVLGYWNGRNEALTNLSQAIAPLIFATLYDEIGNKRGQEMLLATAAVSLLAVFAYVPLIKMLPPPPKPDNEKPEIKELEVYEKMSDVEFGQLELEIVDQIGQKWLEKGKAPRIVSWGNYESERPSLNEIGDRALKDFRYVNGQIIQMLSSRKYLIEQQSLFKQFEDAIPKPDRDKAKLEMGAWIADYFDDAGYTNWETQCQMFKSMLMTAFPPIDPLDEAKPDFGTMPPKQLETHLTKFLTVLDEHIAAEERHIKPKISVGSFNTLLKRRT